MIIVALNVKVQKIQQAKETKIAILDDPTHIWRPLSREPRKYPHKTYLTRK